MSLSGRIRPGVEAAPWVIDEIKALEQERDALRAKVEAMEKQEPVAWAHPSGGVLRVLGTGLEKATYTIPLYALPGAQPAPSVPEGFALVNAAHFLAVLDREDWRTAKNRAELRAMLAAGKLDSTAA